MIYYLVCRRAQEDSTPLITTFEYVGPVDGKPQVHYFKACGLANANVFLDQTELHSLLDLQGLKTCLLVTESAS